MGDRPRKVALLVGPTGRKDEFVVNEVIYRPKNPQELQSFLTAYSGTVLRDGKPFLLPEVAARNPEQPPSGWYLIRIDPQRSELNDLATYMERGGSQGLHVFSSEDAARLGALFAREKVRTDSRSALISCCTTTEWRSIPTVPVAFWMPNAGGG